MQLRANIIIQFASSPACHKNHTWDQLIAFLLIQLTEYPPKNNFSKGHIHNNSIPSVITSEVWEDSVYAYLIPTLWR